MLNKVWTRSVPAVFILLLALTCPWIHGQEKARITGTYTSMQYIPEAGDIFGEELHIVMGWTGYQGAYQDAEGVPGPLVVVNIKVADGKISFDLPPGAGFVPPGKFEGTINDGTIRGHHFSKGEIIGDEVIMKRGKSYWD